MMRASIRGCRVEPTAISPRGILVSHPADITRLSSFQKDVYWLVQDEAAQLISYLVNPKNQVNIF